MAEKPLDHKQLFQGAMILSISGILVKVLSAVYRIPYQNIAGDVGFYIYQQVYPFYGIALILATTGFPSVISKLIAERDQENQYYLKEILLSSALILGALGVGISAGLYALSDWLASAMGDSHLAPLLQIISFSFLIMPVSSVLRGYFQGNNDMIPTAVSQVAEQFVRVATILLLSSVLLKYGYTLYDAGAGAVFGSITGGITGIILLAGFVRIRKEANQHEQMPIRVKYLPVIMKAILLQGLSFCLTGLILVLIQLIDSLHLYSLLREGMMDLAAKEWKGIYDRGQPLIQLGTVVVTSLSLTIVPLISRYVKKGEKTEIVDKTRLALKIGLGIGMAASAGLICLIRPINEMLFTDTKGSGTLAILATSIMFTSLIIVSAAILQSLGHTWKPIFYVLLGLLSKWMFNQLLVPNYQIAGAAIATVLSYIIMAWLFIITLRKQMRMSLFFKRDVLIITAGTLCMSLALGVYSITFNLFLIFNTGRMFITVFALTGVVIGASVFTAMILRMNLFSAKELAFLPGGTKFISKGKNSR